jgi:hypothetical protein
MFEGVAFSTRTKDATLDKDNLRKDKDDEGEVNEDGAGRA